MLLSYLNMFILKKGEHVITELHVQGGSWGGGVNQKGVDHDEWFNVGHELLSREDGTWSEGCGPTRFFCYLSCHL